MMTFYKNIYTVPWTLTFTKGPFIQLDIDHFVGLTLLTEVLARCSDKLNKQSSMDYRILRLYASS